MKFLQSLLLVLKAVIQLKTLTIQKVSSESSYIFKKKVLCTVFAI